MTLYRTKDDIEIIRNEVNKRGRDSIPWLQDQIRRGCIDGIRLPAAQKVLQDHETSERPLDWFEAKPNFFGFSFDLKAALSALRKSLRR